MISNSSETDHHIWFTNQENHPIKPQHYLNKEKVFKKKTPLFAKLSYAFSTVRDNVSPNESNVIKWVQVKGSNKKKIYEHKLCLLQTFLFVFLEFWQFFVWFFKFWNSIREIITMRKKSCICPTNTQRIKVKENIIYYQWSSTGG